MDYEARAKEITQRYAHQIYGHALTADIAAALRYLGEAKDARYAELEAAHQVTIKDRDAARLELGRRETREDQWRRDMKAEVAKLHPLAAGFETASETTDICIAAGAHDALRWALGLAAAPVSENIGVEEEI